MGRYKFLAKESVYEALNKLRAAFLAARDGNQVESIIKGLLTYDERMKLGRRIQIAQMIEDGYGHTEIVSELKVGSPTIRLVAKKMAEYPECFELINVRENKVEKTYKSRAYKKVGGPLKVYKSTEYTGYKRKDVER